MTYVCASDALVAVAPPPAVATEPLRRVFRWGLIGLGAALMALGSVFAVLPGHIGVPVVLAGLIMVLRNSSAARRKFIRYQRRHPNLVFPIRRLIRRDPEIAPVLWQQVLRTERVILPSRWRRAARWRRAIRRRD